MTQLTIWVKKLPFKKLWLAVIGSVVLRLVILPMSPPGFYVDEAATGAHVASMVQQGTDAWGNAWPLFASSLGGGYTTPAYLYPLTGWAHIFGYSEVSLRYFSQFVTLLAVFFMALGMRLWTSNKAALIFAVVALALPWGWLQGSLAWDPAIVPLFLALGFFTFSILFYASSTKAVRVPQVVMPLAFVALAYSYPPCRVTAPLLLVAFYGLLYYKKRLTLKQIGLGCLVAFVAAIPLAMFMFQPEALMRTRELSIFRDVNPLEGFALLLVNMFLLVNPMLLFIFGDPNIRHSAGLQGMLGVAALLPMVAATRAVALRKRPLFSRLKERPVFLLGLIAIFGLIVGVVGSALTAEGQPHTLRATAAWPFLAVLITLGWLLILKQGGFMKRAAMIVFVSGTLTYAIQLAFFYPAEASSAFDVDIRQKIQAGEHVEYQDVARRYYDLRE